MNKEGERGRKEGEPSVRLVRISRTPQLISNPTPPGDTTLSGLAMSKAARGQT
jgi:hypothetical protein